MKTPVRRDPGILLAIVVSLGALGLVTPPPVRAGPPGTATTLARDAEPVIVTGATVPAMIGLPVDQLFVYVYLGKKWRPIPAQIDEITAAGNYSAFEDAILDSNDEIIFMARDTSDQAPDDAPITATLPAGPGVYEIQVQDPNDPYQVAWAYLVQARAPLPTADSDYVSFDPGFHRIHAENYSLGLGVTHQGAGYLTLGRTGPEILDRFKMRLYCRVPLVCPITEDSLPPQPDDLVKDGPVRVILREGRILAYDSMVQWISTYAFPEFLKGDFRISTDFTGAVTGATLFNAAVPLGVTVDGVMDDVPAEPVSPWWQLSTPTGSLIQILDLWPIGGRPYNYYADNSERDSQDTGDRSHYGDVGVIVADPKLAFTFTTAFYVLPNEQTNVGASYYTYFHQRLIVKKVVLQGDPRPAKRFLPLIANFPASEPPVSLGVLGG